MKCSALVLLGFLVILLIEMHNVNADIPVHCLKSQIQGKWNFKGTVPQTKQLNELYKFTCGHEVPSQESSSHVFNMNPGDFTMNFSIELNEDDSAVLQSSLGKRKEGKWTMVYDEGFDIIFNGKSQSKKSSYFTFSRYGKNKNRASSIKSKWVSYCYESLIGWFYIGNKWGCFYGIKEGHQRDEVTNGEASNKQMVVQNSITPVRNDGFGSNAFLEKGGNYYLDQHDTNDVVEAEILENRKMNQDSFLESESLLKNKLQLTSQFKDHEKFVEMINSSSGSTWKAESYEEFANMTLEQLNSFAGRRKKYTGFERLLTSKHMKPVEKRKPLMNKKHHLNFNPTQDTEFPQNFSWKNFMSEARSQGRCGSCFATSTLSMLEARLRIHYPTLVKKYFPNPADLKLSLSHVLKCSYYNQGCNGGYSYLVLKFFNEFELLHENCFDENSGQCERKCSDPSLNRLKFLVKDYKYNGGSYGKCSERAIMEDVHKNGPMVVSLEPDYSFMFYKNGIYQTPNRNWMMKNLSKPQWEKVDHSVLLVGWGVEEVNGEKVKYWLLQNSWGNNWGEGGYMRFIRGTDHLGIESICESGMPVVIEN